MKNWVVAAGAIGLLGAMPAAAQELRPDQVKFRELYKELVETNTTLSSGSCTLAAERMGAHLKAAGYADSELTYFSAPEHPKEGGLVAVLPGTSRTAKPLLLLAHIDVVEARRSDWQRDPFTLVEENGYFYARGTADDKAMASIWTDLMVRLKQEGAKLERTVKLALTCGEETTGAFNGAQWLAQNRPGLIAAEFALNEGGGGRTDGKGQLLVQNIQVGEKAVQNYRLETTSPGGHSSIPVPDNAIYELADALVKLRDHEFAVQLNDTTRAYFAKAGAARGDELGQAMVAIAAHPNDKAAEAVLNRDRTYHSLLRTTCVATLLEGGHANNALPQHAEANVNCRLFPGNTVEATQAALEQAIGNPKVTVTRVPPIRPLAKPPPLEPKVIGPMEKLAARYFPGVPVIPSMTTGGTDGVFLGAIGIPVYGVPGLWLDPDSNGAHGLNERMEVRALYTGRDYLTELVKTYANTH
ncbi:M20/M25/M40 family metallo-hydrolase [Archangium sp.]|uniref:M20/M25/M40 family metallo-hydrolase n=1 Tax=Archangium sp. TaxID=1872627 RepID=UPI003899C7AC